ncbi:MAG: YraN family protein [Pseudomonadota bacterium]
MATTRLVGDDRERRAARHLKQHGLKIVTANYRSRLGEIDIVATDRDCLVFVEVRYRRNHQFGRAVTTVDEHKQRKLIMTAQGFLAKHPRLASRVCRFDVIGFDGDDVRWLKDAFRPW